MVGVVGSFGTVFLESGAAGTELARATVPASFGGFIGGSWVDRPACAEVARRAFISVTQHLGLGGRFK